MSPSRNDDYGSLDSCGYMASLMSHRSRRGRRRSSSGNKESRTVEGGGGLR